MAAVAAGRTGSDLLSFVSLRAYLPVVAPLCVSSGVISCCATGMFAASSFRGGLGLAALARPAGGRRFAAGWRLALARRLVAVRRFAVVRRLAVVRRFTGVRFFRAPHVSYASPYVPLELRIGRNTLGSMHVP